MPPTALDADLHSRAPVASSSPPHSQVNPPLHLSQKLDLATAGISSIISLPPIMPSLDRKDSASLYSQVLPPLPIHGPSRLLRAGSCSHAAHTLLSQALCFSTSTRAPVSGGDSLGISPQVLGNYWPIDLVKPSREFSA